MRGSILVYGGTKKQREKWVNDFLVNDLEFSNIKENPDVVWLELEEKKKSLGIKEVRELNKDMSQRPFSGQYRAAIINPADKLTTPAQNALLKTLEEPPSYSNIFLLTKNINSVLPTVVSRCQKVDIARVGELEKMEEDIENIGKEEKEEVSYVPLFQEILKMSIGERLDFIGEFAKEDRELVIEVLESWIIEGRELLIEEPNTSNNLPESLKTIKEFMDDIENTNVNLKLALETMVITL